MKEKTIGGPLGVLPSYLRLALIRFAEDTGQYDPQTYLNPIHLDLKCQVKPHEEIDHPHNDGTGFVA